MSLYFLPASPQPESLPIPVDAGDIPRSWRRPLGVAAAAAVAALLHGAVAVWYLNRPESDPFSEAASLPTIDIALAAPPSSAPAQPEVQPLAALPAPARRPKPAPAKKPKAKAERKVPERKPEPPAEPRSGEVASPDETAAPAPPPVKDSQDHVASPRSETYTPASSDAGYLNNPRPVYPSAAKQRHWEGLVLLRVSVTVDGHCSDVSVARSSGHEVLDESALEAGRKWMFVPAKRGSTPLASVVSVPIEFNLE